MNTDRRGVQIVLAFVLLAGCGGEEAATGPKPRALRPDPNYVARPRDVAILLCPFDPGSRIPYVQDLDVYHRIYENLRRGQWDMIPAQDTAYIRWVAPGCRVEVLNVQDQGAVDSSNRIDDRVAEADPKYFESKGRSRVIRKPWAKIDRIGPDASGITLSDRMGFTPIEFVVRPLP